MKKPYKKYPPLEKAAQIIYQVLFDASEYHDLPIDINQHLEELKIGIEKAQKSLKENKRFDLQQNLDTYVFLQHYNINATGFTTVYDKKIKDTFDGDLLYVLLKTMCLCRIINMDITKMSELQLRYIMHSKGNKYGDK